MKGLITVTPRFVPTISATRGKIAKAPVPVCLVLSVTIATLENLGGFNSCVVIRNE